MRRLLIPALGAALLALAACGAEPQNETRPATSPATAADVVDDAELRTVTLNVMGMG